LQKFNGLAQTTHNANSDDFSAAGRQEQAIYSKLSDIDQKIKGSSKALQGLKDKNQLIASSSKYLGDFIEDLKRNSGKQLGMLEEVAKADNHLKKQ